jgi:predicted membrane-bound spermidine synthase
VLIAAKTLISIGLAIYFALLGDHIYEKSKSILYNVSRTDQKASLLEYLESMQKNIQIKSFASQFQVADWVTYFNQPSFSRLYLDGAFQFDSFDQSGYHDPFWQGGLYFSNFTPKKILIMGGGDGLLAATLYKDAKTKNDFDLTLVELDPMIPQLAYENWHILERNVLHYLKLQLGDAFDFIRTHHNEWQAIFLDFPDPRSADLSKLYSVEFYTMLRKNLSRNGFIVLDYPAKNSLNIIYSTLRAAGFINIIIYGSGNTFVYADQKIRSENELQSLKNQSLFKVWPATHFDPSQVNSIFDLRLPEEQSFQVFQAWWSK